MFSNKMSLNKMFSNKTFSMNNKISVQQLCILLLLDVFGTGVIILPRTAAEFANQDGWLVIIAATAFAFVFAYIITSLGRMFPGDSFIVYSSKIIGRPFGYLFSIGLIFKIIAALSMELRLFCEIVKQTLLFNTPFYVVAISMLFVGGYAAAKGYETRARIAQILSVVVFIPIIAVFCIGAVDTDFSNALPFMASSPIQIILGGFFCVSAFTGLELVLLVHPYISTPKNVRKAVLQTVCCIGALMVFITFITICKSGPVDIKRQMWPVLEMMDLIEIPGSFIERQNAFVMSFWIVSVFAVINAGLFFSSLLMKDMFKRGKHSYYILGTMISVFLLSLAPKNIQETWKMLELLFITFGVAYFFAIPLLLLIIAKLRGIGEK